MDVKETFAMTESSGLVADQVGLDRASRAAHASQLETQFRSSVARSRRPAAADDPGGAVALARRCIRPGSLGRASA